jgi:hypothetical protein
MKITRHEALVLAKVLHQHIDHLGRYGNEKSSFRGALEDLAEKIDDFLVNVKECNEGCRNLDDEDEVNEEKGEDEESFNEDGDKNRLVADIILSGTYLHELSATKSKDGAVEFERVKQAHACRVDVLVDGYCRLKDVTHLRRKSKELHVRTSSGKWYIYHVANFSNDWINALPVNKLVEVYA